MRTVGVIGLGSIGKRHVSNLQALGHIVWGFDPKASSMVNLGKDFRARNVRDLFEADAIVIASPSDDHSWHILTDAHRMPMFVEKPIGTTGHNAAEIEAVLKFSKQPMMVGYNLRFHSCVKKAKEWLDAGLIGDPTWASFTLGQYNDRPAYLRDGVILNWSHEIDLCLYLLGAADVAGSSTRITDGKDDITDILLTHKSGCRSTVHLDYTTKPEIRQFFIGGTTGAMEVYLVSRAAYLNSNGVIAESAFRGSDTWNDNYIEEMQAFLDRCDGKETIGCTGEEGLEVLKICLEVRKQAGLE